MIDELNSKYTEFKNVIDILPVNTKYNRKRKLDCILDEEKNDNERLSIVRQEIENRLSKFNNLKANDKIEELEKQLEKCNIINEWNNYNTAYEKMHLDYYLYQLHRYYKEDLESVNACIKKILDSFKKVEIVLTKEDFDFNNYARDYMEKILSNASNEELKLCFEELYWKNSDIIRTIEINFKSIYLRNEKKINKYYETRHLEFLKNHKDSEISDMRVKLSDEIKALKGNDIYLEFQKFVSGEYSVSDFKEAEILKKRDTYFEENSYTYNNLLDLNKVLNEYNILIKYKYLLSDMKDKLDKKIELKNSKNNALKEINKEETSLKKLNAKRNRKPLFGKKKNDDKWLFEYKKILTDITKNYDEFDKACFNDLVFEKLTQDSTIIEVLRLISSNYLYFVSKTCELDENQSINIINDNFNELKNYVNNNDFTLLNNVALLDEKQMKQLIVDKYNLGRIKLTIDNLLDDNIDRTISDINNLIDYENIINSGLNIDDVAMYLDFKKLLDKDNK